MTYQIFFSSRASTEHIPDPDLRSAEEQVADKIRALHDEVESNLDSEAARGRFGMNLYIHDFMREALPCFERAAPLNPAEFSWPYCCAIILDELSSPRAFEWFECSRHLSQDCAPVHVLYGEALLEVGRGDEASESFQGALDVDRKFTHAYLE